MRCDRPFLSRCVSVCLFASLGVLSPGFLRPALSAEWLVTKVGHLEVSVPIDDLEAFAEEGSMSPPMAAIASEFDEQQLILLRHLLSQQVRVSQPEELVRFTYAPMVESLLDRLGRAFRTQNGDNGGPSIRNGIILAASDEASLSLINVLRKFPGEAVQVDLATLIRFTGELALQLDYRNAALEAIAQDSRQEATSAVVQDTLQSDWQQPGPYGVRQETVTVPVRAIRPTEIGFVSAYDFDVDIYWPEGRSDAAPVLLMTHGFGATRTNYAYLAQHWASHGFVVVAPEHVGSDLTYRQVFLDGHLSDILSPMEYLSRSLDLTYTLDYLEQRAAENEAWAARLNLGQVGVFGNSLGGSTALSVAGATIDEDRLQQECTDDNLTLNLAVTLQCPAKHLPPVDYDLHDPRIKAVVAAYPMTRYLFGPEGMGAIATPTLLFSGGNDIIAPAIQEQIHPFVWLNTPDKYLALVENGTHFTSSDDVYIEGLPSFLRPPSTAAGRDYLEALSLAFFKRYLEGDETAAAGLTPTYAQSISQEAMPLYLIRSLSAEQLETAFGGTPPEPVVPFPASAPSPVPYQSVLDEIAATGTLRVGIRADAAPFGYLDREGTWTGYCFDLVNELGDELERSLGLTSELSIVRLPSNLNNRFSLVEDGTVHLECGPNTIRRDVAGIQFSYPYFYTGTQFLALRSKAASITPDTAFQGARVGLLNNSTNADFVQLTFPLVQPTYFDGPTGRADAVQSLTSGSIDAFASDGALLLGELLRQGQNPDDYALIPDTPLTCDGYGLVLPEGDRTWQATVNRLLRSDTSRGVQAVWLSDYLPGAIAALQYCLSTADPG